MRKQITAFASFLVVLGLTSVRGWQDNPAAVGNEAEKVEIKKGSALAKLISESEKHETAKGVALVKAAADAAKNGRYKSDLPDWLCAHYRRNHPVDRAAVVGPLDPTGGYPLALESLYTWMLLHQDLQPDAPRVEAKAATIAKVGPNLRISGGNTTPESESDIRINPANPKQIIAASNNIGGSRQAQFFSSDGGATWGQTALPLLPGDSHHTDPTVDWSTDGTAWATTIGVDAGTAGLQMRAYRSSDGGRNWTFDGTFSGQQTSSDKQLMWIDRSATSPFKDTIYVIWHNEQPAFVNRRLSSGWQAPRQVSGAETSGTGIGGDITTNSAGDAFAVWPDTGSHNVFLSKSIDGGATFGAPIPVARTLGAFDIGIPAFAKRRLLIYASIAAFRNATRNDVYVSWCDLAGGAGCGTPANEPANNVNSACTTRIFFARSVDGGTHWEAPQRVNNPAELSDQFNQRLAVDPKTGNLGIIYSQSGTGTKRKKTDIFFQASVDNGKTWSTPPTKVTTASTDETTVNADLGNQYGDYNGLSVADGVFFPCFTDRRDNKAEAIVTAKITLKTNAAGVVQPVVAGPAAAGGVGGGENKSR